MTRNTWIAAAAAALACVGLLAWALAPRPLAVETATVQAGRYEQAISEDGRTRLRERYTVTAPLAGQLARISLHPGDAVAEGATLALLAPALPPLLDPRTRAELTGRREGAEAGVQRAAANAEQLRVALAQARADLKRSELLAQQGFIAPTRLESDRLALRAAQQGLESAVQARHMADHDLEVTRSALATLQAGGSAGGFVLRAPVAGQVLRVLQASEGMVAMGMPLLEIGDTRQLEIVAELLTAEALQAAPGTPVLIDRWGGPGVLKGQVRQVEPAAFTKVSALGVEEQRVNVLIDLDSAAAAAAPGLGDGFRVGVRILTRVQEGALQVPVSAVFPHPGQPAGMAVFVFSEGVARLKPVVLGGRNGSQAWVQQGLAAGETVIIYPPAELADGARVQRRRAGT